ncbi:hypothetical protein MRX96_008183 [Rhipicephalus microplus]
MPACAELAKRIDELESRLLSISDLMTNRIVDNITEKMESPGVDVYELKKHVDRLGPSLVARALGWSALFSLVTQFTAHGASFALTFALQPGRQVRALLLKLPVKPTSTKVVLDAILVFLSGRNIELAAQLSDVDHTGYKVSGRALSSQRAWRHSSEQHV